MVRKNIIIFGICVIISIFSWLSIKLSQNYQQSFDLKFKLTNLPKGVEINSLSDSVINVTFKSQGFRLIGLLKTLQNASTLIDFSKYTNAPFSMNGKMAIPLNLVIEQYNINSLNGAEIISFTPDTLKLTYTEISHKKLPVRPVFKYPGNVNINIFSSCTIFPDSILITGQNIKIDTLNCILTEPIDITKFIENEMVNVKIANPFKDNNSRFSNQSVDIRLSNDNKVEFTLDLNIDKVNEKDYQTLPNPTKTSACFEIPISLIDRVNPDSFKVIMLMNEATNGTVPIKITKQLNNSKLVRLSPIFVNYKRVRK